MNLVVKFFQTLFPKLFSSDPKKKMAEITFAISFLQKELQAMEKVHGVQLTPSEVKASTTPQQKRMVDRKGRIIGDAHAGVLELPSVYMIWISNKGRLEYVQYNNVKPNSVVGLLDGHETNKAGITNYSFFYDTDPVVGHILYAILPPVPPEEEDTFEPRK
jgi:hypothetical protein